MKLKLPKFNLSLQLLVILIGALLFGSFLPESLQALLYTISLNLKNLLLFILPAVIFSCLFSCLLTFRGASAIGFMLILFSIVFVSNYLSTLIAYGVGTLDLLTIDFLKSFNLSQNDELKPLVEIIFPKWISNDTALIIGFFTGSLFAFYPNRWADQFSAKAKRFVTLVLEKGFVPILPVFALGFILKMQYDGILMQIIESYLPLMLIIVVTYVLYLIFLFGLAAKFKPQQWLEYLKNIVPVALTGFSTMSSLATMPVTLNAAEKNTGNVDISRAVIPATVNVHMVGVAIAVPLMMFAILVNFGFPFPSFSTYCLFAVYFVLAQFAVAAVPGGGILVMLPLLETHFGFTSEMSALITALYILFDPAITITNVLGNSALVIFVAKLFKSLTLKANPA